MLHFFHTWEPTAVALSLGIITIHWYGLLIASAVVIFLLLAKRLLPKTISFDEFTEAVLVTIVSGLIGARLYEVFVINWWYYQQDLWAIFRVWEGGLAIHGGIIFGALALYGWCRWRQKHFWQLTDIAVVGLPLAQAIGRWGNYFNQELFGRPTTDWWGIPISVENRPDEFMGATHFQPLFLYESLLNLSLFGLLFFIYKRGKLHVGQLSGLYLVGYGLIRFGMEWLRIDPTPLLWGIRLPQLLSVLLIVVGLALHFWYRERVYNCLILDKK